MKTLLPLLIAFLSTFSFNTRANQIKIDWTKSETGSGAQQVAGVVSLNGKMIVVGNFTGNYQNNTGNHNSAAGSTDCFVTCYNSLQQIQWSLVFGNTCNERIQSVATDAVSGNVYITGAFYNTLTIGGNTISSNGGTDVFLAAFTENGNMLWLKSFGSQGSDEGVKCLTDASGNILLAMNTSSFQLPGSDQQSGGSSICIAKFNAAGNLIWSQCETAGVNGIIKVNDMHLTATGNIVAAGQFFGNLLAGDGGSLNYQSANDAAWVGSYHSNGTTDFVFVAGNSGFGSSGITGVTSDLVGNLQLFGYYEGSFEFSGMQSIAGDRNMMLLEMDQYGNELNVEFFESAGYQQPGKIVCTSQNQLVMTGYYIDVFNSGTFSLTNNGGLDAFVIFKSLGTGAEEAMQIGGAGDEIPFDLTVNGNEIYAAGCFGLNQTNANTQFNNTSVTSDGECDGFVSKLSSMNQTTGFSEGVTSPGSLKAYPNPASSSLQITLNNNESALVMITDLSGKLVKTQQSQPFTGTLTIDISELPSGVYILMVTESAKTEKIRIEKI